MLEFLRWYTYAVIFLRHNRGMQPRHLELHCTNSRVQNMVAVSMLHYVDCMSWWTYIPSKRSGEAFAWCSPSKRTCLHEKSHDLPRVQGRPVHLEIIGRVARANQDGHIQEGDQYVSTPSNVVAIPEVRTCFRPIPAIVNTVKLAHVAATHSDTILATWHHKQI